MISVADNHFDSHRSSSASIKLKHHHADPRPNQAINVERSRDHGPYEGSSPHTQQHRTNMHASAGAIHVTFCVAHWQQRRAHDTGTGTWPGLPIGSHTTRTLTLPSPRTVRRTLLIQHARLQLSKKKRNNARSIVLLISQTTVQTPAAHAHWWPQKSRCGTGSRRKMSLVYGMEYSSCW